MVQFLIYTNVIKVVVIIMDDIWDYVQEQTCKFCWLGMNFCEIQFMLNADIIFIMYCILGIEINDNNRSIMMKNFLRLF